MATHPCIGHCMRATAVLMCRKLNANLVALGYATRPELDSPSDYFS